MNLMRSCFAHTNLVTVCVVYRLPLFNYVCYYLNVISRLPEACLDWGVVCQLPPVLGNTLLSNDIFGN